MVDKLALGNGVNDLKSIQYDPIWVRFPSTYTTHCTLKQNYTSVQMGVQPLKDQGLNVQQRRILQPLTTSIDFYFVLWHFHFIYTLSSIKKRIKTGNG